MIALLFVPLSLTGNFSGVDGKGNVGWTKSWILVALSYQLLF
jgi:hypothetical protein